MNKHWLTRFLAFILGMDLSEPETIPIRDFSTPVGRAALERKADEFDRMALENIQPYNSAPEFYRAQANHYRESAKA